MDAGRLCNFTYSVIVAEVGGRENLDRVLARAAAPPKGKRRGPVRHGMTKEQAARMAANMDDWDTKIAKGVNPDG